MRGERNVHRFSKKRYRSLRLSPCPILQTTNKFRSAGNPHKASGRGSRRGATYGLLISSHCPAFMDSSVADAGTEELPKHCASSCVRVLVHLDRTDRTLSHFQGRPGSFELNDGRSCANMIDHFTPPAFFKTGWNPLLRRKIILLQVKDKEIEELRSQLLQAKDESMEVARLRTRVSSLEAIEGSLRGERLVEASSSSLRSPELKSCESVNELETSSTNLRGKLEMYEGSMKQLEEFQDNLIKPLEARLAKIDADLPYIPDFNSVVRDLRGLDFLLLLELFAKKDASTWDVMDLLRLDHAVAEVLGMTDLQPNAGQLMVPVHHKQDKVVIGSQALSVALETYHYRVQKMERNLAERLPLLRDVFVSIDHPVSTEALDFIISGDILRSPLVRQRGGRALVLRTALSTMVIRPTPDPFLLVEDYENLDLTGVVPADVIPGSKGEGNVEGSPTGDAGDVFSHLENEARDAVL
ncbi:hypothetical protein Tco_1094247 [Tanacetum coccineum]|uniref:Uncharacterized protein n=1 Tax=Tanacetum coccineum TaxID=301880 RepID=A0ABQ5IGB2_9ASTR